MGLIIEKTGDLIDISEDAVHRTAQTGESDESFCISGIAEAGNMLYRIVDIDAIINKYKHPGEKYV
jgi:chemotaxis signal transduction protein